MKSLIAGIVLILLIGIGGFIYRNVKERTGPDQMACTAEAKICPDGSAVGRSGPSCAFAPCAYPNVEFADAQLAFALPAGYQKGVQQPGADGEVDGMLDFYEKPSASPSVAHFITVYKFGIPAGKTANDVILAHTVYSPSGMTATSLDKFSSVFVNGKTFKVTTIERFEGQVHTAYYLPRATDVLRFDVVERDVTEWTNPDLVIDDLPQHKALLQMLSTLQTP